MLSRSSGNDQRSESHREALARIEKRVAVTQPTFSPWSDYSEARGGWENNDGGELRTDSQEALRGRTERSLDRHGVTSLSECSGESAAACCHAYDRAVGQFDLNASEPVAFVRTAQQVGEAPKN